MTTTTMLRCSTCKQALPDEAFSLDRQKTNRRQRRNTCRRCDAERERLRRAGLLPEHYTLPDRIVDLLDIDGGWWTTEALADRLDVSVEHVARSLYRMLYDGRLRRRYREMNGLEQNRPEWSTT